MAVGSSAERIDAAWRPDGSPMSGVAAALTGAGML